MAFAMRTGKLNTLVIIEKSTATVDSYGDEVITWAEFTKAWAEIKTNSGKEFMNAKEINSSVEKLLKIRYVSGITPGMRVNDGGNYYNILSSFDPTNQRERIMLACNVNL